MVIEFTNPQDIPDNLPNGRYTTKVIEAKFTKTDLLIRLEYVGDVYNPRDPQCLFPMNVAR